LRRCFAGGAGFDDLERQRIGRGWGEIESMTLGMAGAARVLDR